MNPSRRNLLLGLGAAAAAGAFLLRPHDQGAPHDDYFSPLNALLRTRGLGRPTLVIDLDRFDRNCARLKESIGAGKNLRIVAKSLPSVPLIRHAMEKTGATRVMSFHQPFLTDLAREIPTAEIMLGKPMPVRAAEIFYSRLDAQGAFDPRRQLQWLIDTPERIAQYQQLARTLGTKMRFSVEIDVGLHRGGLAAPEQLDALLATINADPDHLEFAGFMGYDAHVGKIPSIMESRETSLQKAIDTYQGFISRTKSAMPSLDVSTLTLNGAGSPTFRLHKDNSPLNDVSVGSALAKPSDFDLELLSDFEPAAFIATPVIKALDGLRLPGSDALGKVWAAWDINRQRTFFMYGGKWLAKFASPRGLADNNLYGASSNQAIVNASASVKLQPDDYIFLRPTQSEAVFLQFGDLLAVRSGRIEAHLPVLTPDHDGVLPAA